MTGRKILDNALTRLGYKDNGSNDSLSRRIKSAGLITVNDIYADLWNTENEEKFKPIASLDEEIKLSAKALTIMVYGVAAFIAQSEDDGDMQQTWIELYNRKRASLSKITGIQDVIAKGYDL